MLLSNLRRKHSRKKRWEKRELEGSIRKGWERKCKRVCKKVKVERKGKGRGKGTGGKGKGG